jgi:hypothetical protein
MNKVLKVIVTTFEPRIVRQETQVCGKPPGYFSHSQNFTTVESIIDLLKLNIEREVNCNPGEYVDILIVNNDNGSQIGNKFLESINGKSTGSGVVITRNRENFGRAFGGYNFAIEEYIELYDYFIFTEDDVLISGNKYATKAIDVLKNNDGLVAYIGISGSLFFPRLFGVKHAHGSIGMVSGTALRKIIDNLGCLPFAHNKAIQDYREIIEKGEIGLSQSIIQQGMKLSQINKSDKLYEYAYDLMRNIKRIRYLNFYQKADYYIRRLGSKIK